MTRRAALPALLLAFALLLAVTAPARAAAPLWRAYGPHAQVTLFGSVHLLTPGLDWRSPALDAELARADAVWFEIPLDPAAQAGATRDALARGLLPAGETLSAELPAAQAERLRRAATTLGVWPMLDRDRPWLAEVTLSVLEVERQGARRDLGVEGEIDRAAPSRTERGALETVSQQLGFFADAPEAEQVASLEETLRELDDDPGLFARLTAAWARGDVAELTHDALDPLRAGAPATYQRLVVARNRAWVRRIEGLLRGGRRVFMVVGVGHLVGPDSVPALLRRDGIRVEGP